MNQNSNDNVPDPNVDRNDNVPPSPPASRPPQTAANNPYVLAAPVRDPPTKSEFTSAICLFLFFIF